MRVVTALAAVFAVATITVAGSQSAHAETPADQAGEQKIVEVQRGDSLSKIAKAHDSTYQRIFYANTDIKDPDVIYPGQKVRIPTGDEALTERPIPSNTPVAAPAPKPAAKPAVKPAAKPTPAPRRTVTGSEPAPAATAPTNSVWDRLAQCESSGNWAINTGNGYYGGLQFSLSSWRMVGGQGYPHQASKAEQIKRAEMLQARQGWGAWPACTAKLGIR